LGACDRFGRICFCWHCRWRSIPQRTGYNPRADANSNGNTDCNRDTYANSNAESNTEAAADSAASPNPAPVADIGDAGLQNWVFQITARIATTIPGLLRAGIAESQLQRHFPFKNKEVLNCICGFS
jgi:hypothetical protein